MSDPRFASAQEFKDAIDWIHRTLSEDPELGPRYQAAGVSQRFEFSDLDLVLHVRPADGDEPGCVHWEWTADVAWEPTARLRMRSETANRFWQGKENVVMAIARRRIKAGGDIKRTLALIPIMRPLHERYRGYLADEHPELLA
jgi:hypothetical protein